jgi:spore germination protein GerM
VRISRFFFWIAALAIVAVASWYAATHRAPSATDHIVVYYTKDDGTSEVPWTVSMRPQQPNESDAEHRQNTVLYAATQAVAGPPSGTPAIRFPSGTHVLSARVNDSTATVDLSEEVKNQTSDVTGESGAFKSLVWTLTALPGVEQVAIRIQGQTLTTLPGGHLEIDEPLRRSDW